MSVLRYLIHASPIIPIYVLTPSNYVDVEPLYIISTAGERGRFRLTDMSSHRCAYDLVILFMRQVRVVVAATSADL